MLNASDVYRVLGLIDLVGMREEALQKDLLSFLNSLTSEEQMRQLSQRGLDLGEYVA